jgi:AcrR family transcriptional regulator
MVRSSLVDRRRHETRCDIARTAMRLFAREGFDGIGAQEIAREAGVSLRTFYRYFSGKDEVLSPVIAQGTENLAAAIASRPAHETLATAVQAACAGITSEAGPENMRTLIRLVVGTPALRAHWLDDLRSIEESLVAVIHERRADASDEDARLTAAAIVAALRLTLERFTRIGSGEPFAKEFGASLRYLRDGAGL